MAELIVPHDRTCPQCGNTYPLTFEYFHRTKSHKYGLCNICKWCRVSNQKAVRQRKRDIVRPRIVNVGIEGVIGLQLTRGQIAIIDDIDGDLSNWHWHAHLQRSYISVVAHRQKKTIRLARVILERILGRLLAENEVVDHKDCDPLNNRRDNLRLADKYQNARNVQRRVDNKSGYKGVHYSKSNGKWCAEIRVNGKHVHLGYRDTPEEAYELYKAAAIDHYGEFARLE